MQTYEKGGVYFISSQVLILDMLKDQGLVHFRLPLPVIYFRLLNPVKVKRKINGILVLSAEKAIKSFDEGFIIGLARNKGVDFVQAFTNHAELVAKKLEKILQALLLDNVEAGFSNDS